MESRRSIRSEVNCLLPIASVELTKSEDWSQHAVLTHGKAECDFLQYNCSPRVWHQEWCLFILMKLHLEMKQFSKALSLETASRVRDTELWHVEEIKGDPKN